MTSSDDDIRFSAPRRLLGEVAAASGDATEFDLLRADDQVNLRFCLHGGSIDPITNRVTALEPEEPIYFEIAVGRQHHVEAAIATGDEPPAEALSSVVAGESRIAVQVPDGLDFTVANLLDLGTFALMVAETPSIEPGATETAVEIPVGLVLSPTEGSRFDAPTTPHTHGSITERWRARLRSDPGDGSGRLVALYSHAGTPSFDVDVDEQRRGQLIDQTQIDPLVVRRLDLSPTGAEYDVSGLWATGQPLSYQHRVVTGRDLRIEIVDRGFLAPFGHRAVVTRLTERQLLPDTNGELTAVLVTEEHLTIADPTVEGPHPYVAYEGRALPFTRLDAADTGAGPITKAQLELDGGGTIQRRRAAAIERDGEPLSISYTATDHDGGRVEFDLPAVFVSDEIAYQPLNRVGRRETTLRRLARWYRQHPDMASADLDGQGVAWAPAPADTSRGDAGAIQITEEICFQLDRPDNASFDAATVEADLRATTTPAFAAKVHRAVVTDQAGATSTGVAPSRLDVVPALRFLEHGLGELNVDLGYLDVDLGDVDVPHVNLPSTQGDGLLSFGFVVDTFSQLLGGGIEIGTDGDWDPLDALGDLSAELLGMIDLVDLLPSINILGGGDGGGGDGGGGGGAAANLPTIEVDVIGDDDPLSIPTGVCTTLAWQPKIQSFPKDADKPTFVVTADFEKAGLGSPTAAFGTAPTEIRLEIETCVPGGVVVDVSLERFAIQLPPSVPVIAALVERVRFVDDSGARSIDTEIAEWVFVGALGWLEPFKDLLFGLFTEGAPSFDDGLALAFEVPLPNIVLGVLNLTQLRAGLALDAPTASPARVEFGLSSLDRPFRVTILGWGGTGHFLVIVDAGDIVLIEGSIGVTYEIAVDVFIVSAAVSISLGAYVRYQREKDGDGEVEFGATVEVAGAVSILGLVKIAGSVMVGLSYRVNAKVLRGVAAVTGEISSLFGTSTVTRDVEIEVDFDESGSGLQRLLAAPMAALESAGTSFGDLFSEEQWAEYCSAFVDAPAAA